MTTEKSLSFYIKVAAGIAVGLSATLCLWVFVITRGAFHECFDFTQTGQIGDTLGGVAAPFIGVVAAITTFLAFYMQYLANQMQNKQFELQSKEREIARHEERITFLIQQNRSLVEGMYIVDGIKGVKCFTKIFHEVRRAHRLARKYFEKSNLSEKQLANIAFTVVFNGATTRVDALNLSLFGAVDNFNGFLERLREINKNARENREEDAVFRSLGYAPFKGHQTRLGHYFRNIFHILTYVESVNPSLMNKDEKIEQVKALRSQLSSYEQIIILFNAMSFYGIRLQREGFLKNYKLVHNIPLPMLSFLGDVSHLVEGLEFEWDETMQYIRDEYQMSQP